VRQIGRSMTDVYLAVDTEQNRRAALKLVKTGGGAANQMVVDAERRGASIQQEMRALDPRVVEIYDVGDADGYFFVAMQYVEGRNLAEILKAEGAMDANRAAVIALEICEQLAKFHSGETAVVHGDIKPSNIHMSPNDTVRLLDFGIARTLRAGHSATVHPFGSPGYCPPERLARSEVDQQSDLWAVGATLYEMLSGGPLYRAQNTRKLEFLIRSKRTPRALPDTVPKPLRLIVAKALAPDASKRYRSAVELMADLHAFLIRKPTLAEMERRSRWNPSATFEIARTALVRATHHLRQRRRRHRGDWPVAQAVIWFSLGMTFSVGASVWMQHAMAYPPALVLPKPKVPGAPVVTKILPAPPVQSAPAKPAPPRRPAAAAPTRRPRLRKFFLWGWR
jgi:serine/threonine protein kinase